MLWGGRRLPSPPTAPHHCVLQQKCSSGLAFAPSQSEEEGHEPVRGRWASGSKKEGGGHELAQKMGLNQPNGGGPLSKGGGSEPVLGREEEARPTQRPLEDLFPLWFFVLPVPLRTAEVPLLTLHPEPG